jgi:hypothetical protein
MQACNGKTAAADGCGGTRCSLAVNQLRHWAGISSAEFDGSVYTHPHLALWLLLLCSVNATVCRVMPVSLMFKASHATAAAGFLLFHFDITAVS